MKFLIANASSATKKYGTGCVCPGKGIAGGSSIVPVSSAWYKLHVLNHPPPFPTRNSTIADNINLQKLVFSINYC
jgi:hypothetical protein